MMERQTSSLVKNSTALISLKGLTGKERNIWEVRKNGKAAREPPVAPKSFTSGLAKGVESETIKFTNPDDVGVVSTIYRNAFTAELEVAVELEYSRLDWGDAQVITLCKALRAAHQLGGLSNLLTLDLSHNRIGDKAMEVLVPLLKSGQFGALPKLQGLILYNNQISDKGVATLATALRDGAMPSCTEYGFRGQVTLPLTPPFPPPPTPQPSSPSLTASPFFLAPALALVLASVLAPALAPSLRPRPRPSRSPRLPARTSPRIASHAHP